MSHLEWRTRTKKLLNTSCRGEVSLSLTTIAISVTVIAVEFLPIIEVPCLESFSFAVK